MTPSYQDRLLLLPGIDADEVVVDLVEVER
jgi:hypothetical protein